MCVWGGGGGGGGGGGAGVFDVGVHLLVFVPGLISQALPHVVAKGDAAAIDMILARVDDKDFQYARTTRHGPQRTQILKV